MTMTMTMTLRRLQHFEISSSRIPRATTTTTTTTSLSTFHALLALRRPT